MRKVSLVICDIDNTLVGHDKILKSKTKQAIDQLKEKGIYFGIASGRPLDEVMLNAKKWGFDQNFDVVIGMNGADLWDGLHDEVHEYFRLEPSSIQEIYEKMMPFNANPYIYRDGKILCGHRSEVMEASAKRANKELVSLEDNIEDLWSEGNAKIMFRVKEGGMEPIEKFIQKNPSAIYNGFKTQPTVVEFAPKETSKAYALRKFCEINNISLDEVIAFGDTTNDNEMLKEAGLGVCLLNGSDDTKAIADEITEKTCEEDGFADYVLKHILS